jgi:hypothetical protein
MNEVFSVIQSDELVVCDEPCAKMGGSGAH